MKTIGCIREILEGEHRVAATPKSVKQLCDLGCTVIIEKDAGAQAGWGDTAYEKAGATIGNPYEADIIVSVNTPCMQGRQHQLEKIPPGKAWVSLFDDAEDALAIIKRRKLGLYALNRIPRISRAQSMDVLSSQSTVAGYKAAIIGAMHTQKLFPLMMTAGGTVKPARVVILGAGVAGLQALATAKRLGAIVEVSDVRPEVKEQIESLGGTFIEVPYDQKASDAQGYAKAASPEYLKRQAAEVTKRLSQCDIAITTALVGGKKAPILISEAMVQQMKSRSVIVDMAAVQGGNCACTVPGKVIVKHGVTIIGYTNIPSLCAHDASALFAQNVFQFVKLLLTEKEDDILTATRIGEVQA